MPIAFVQSASLQGTSPFSLAFPSPNTAGNFIIGVVANSSPGTMSVADTNGNPYASISSFTPDSNFTGQVFFAQNIAAGANSVTLTGGQNLILYEFSGVNAFDKSASATGGGNAEDSGPLTPSSAKSLLLGVVAGTNMITTTVGAGWSGLLTLGASTSISAEYQIVSSIAAYNATFTSTASKGGGNLWIAVIISFNVGDLKLSGGNIQDAAGRLQTGSITFELQPDCQVSLAPAGSPGQVMAGIPASIPFASGAVSGAPHILSNRQLNPAGSNYLVNIKDANGARLNLNPLVWTFTQPPGTTVDLGTMVSS